jgi:hypothetical protein
VTRRSGGAQHVRATPETPRVRVRALTPDETRAWAADRPWADTAPRMAALEQQWEKSGQTDLHALLGALIFCQAQLPPWLFSGLCRLLKQQFRQPQPPFHEIRWLMVRQALDEENLPWDEAYDWASKKLANTPAHGGPDTMMKSYQKIQHGLPKRPRRPQRRRTK